MTKNEALKAAIDGKTVRKGSWSGIANLTYGKDGFVLIDSDGNKAPEETIFRLFRTTMSGDWEIVPNQVDFATAWKAYENGKTVQDMFTDLYNKKEERCRFVNFDSKSIRGKWLILEDE